MLVAVAACTASANNPTDGRTFSLEQFAEHVVSAGPPKDGIPSIDDPRFIAAKNAERFLADDDIVFGLNLDGVVRAYPQKILVWHEIVNDVVGGEPIAVTYCPLTGSSIAFARTIDGKPTELGTTGKLLNSNLVMYDRATGSQWPQILGMAITGPRKGTRLRSFPLVWTTWGQWKAAFPETEVLSKRTGYLRAYGKDPYGSYREAGGYYRAGEPVFPVMSESAKLPAKHVVVGVHDAKWSLAVDKELVRAKKLVVRELGDQPIAILYDSQLDDGIAYKLGSRKLSLREGEIVDDRGVRWTVWGRSERGEQLEHVTSFDAMWFAWRAFFPSTELVMEK